jgi:PAS domain S-box-containing protein
MASIFIRTWSLKARVTFFTLAVFVISIWSLAYYTSRTLREDMNGVLIGQQFSTVSFIAEEIDDELSNRLNVLEKVAGKVNLVTLGNPGALQAFLEDRLILQGPFNGGVVCIGSDGTAIASVPRTMGIVGVNLMDRDHIIGALRDGKATIGRPVIGKKVAAPIIVMAVPIRDPHGKVIGALTGLTDLSKPNFLDRVTEGHYGKTGGYVLVAPRHRLIVTATDKRLIMMPLSKLGTDPMIDRFVQGYEGSGVLVNPVGVEVLASAKHIPAADWYVAAALPTKEAFAPISDMQQRRLLATILLTLLAGSLTWWMLRRQLAPMVSAVESLTALAAADQSAQPLPITRNDEIGDLIGSFNHLLEISARHENALKESEARFRQMFENNASVMLLIEPESGAIADANSAASQFYGYANDDLKKMSIDQINTLSPAETAAARDEAIQEKHNYFVFHHRMAGGAIRTVEVRANPMVVSGQKLLFSIVHDITERKLAETKLQDSEKRFRAIIEASPIPLALNDDQQNVVYLNLAFVRTFGYTLEDMPNLSQWWPKAYPDPVYRQWVETQWQSHLDEARRTNSAFDPLEVNICCKDGSKRTVLAGAESFGVSIEGLHLVTLYDVTELRGAEAERALLEAKLRESQKMEALGTLAGGVAIDFNNALAAILGNLDLARQDVGADHAALVSLEEIGKASRRAKDLVQQILAFGRRQPTDRKATSLSLVVVESARLIRATLPADVTLNVECNPETPAVLADATQIKQILLNLCQNALHAVQGLGRPGVIWICLAGVRQVAPSDNLRPGDYACLSVRDNGSGMDEETRSHIFEPFFTTKPKGKGTGLGLSVVHGIAQAHEASIEIDSALGEGSEFRIYFPACESPVVEDLDAALDTAPTPADGKHVLYVDDEEAIIFLMTRLLERQGYRVSGFTNPQDALSAARANPQQYDIAVTDYSMPGMSGLEVATALREIRADLPVVLASGYITEELRKAAPAAGVLDLIYKPDTVEELCDAVARFASKHTKIATVA